jgi:4-amino-4-deoxy-L-arabinose transferase-like glycosyltransferase
MAKFLTRERFGRPQVLAGLLLLGFLAQCGWLLARGTQPLEMESSHLFRIVEGLQQWSGDSVAGTPSVERIEAGTPTPPEVDHNEGYDPNHSPLWYLIASVPMLGWTGTAEAGSFHYWGWLARTPYLVFGVLLGASLWYVSRRLYGNAGGYIALALYCFSPAILRSSTLYSAQPEMGAAWGAFGAIFTAIAVAHTLYAPREVVVWNWRRILLLGLSLALAIGSQFSLIILLPVALGFMLYLAPTRRRAALAIWLASCGVAFMLLFASYLFRPSVFWQGMRHASFFGITWRTFITPGVYALILKQIGRSGPVLLLAALPGALITYFSWRRPRYFGNTAPLIVAALFLLLSLATPHYPGFGFQLMATPFLFVFVAGIAADLLETRRRDLVMACLWGLLLANALWNLRELARLGTPL